MCPILDQDDYITVSDAKGLKKNIKGACVYKPTIGESWTESQNTIQVPLNCYMVITDANNSAFPVQHYRGPYKFFPEPFQHVVKNPKGNLDYFPCVEVTQQTGVHLKLADGNVVLLDQPQFYMPKIGESVHQSVSRVVMLNTDFCILKSPDGQIFVMNGRNVDDRSFFVKPFFEFVKFQCPDIKTVLSTLPTFMSHEFSIRTQDNVVLGLDLRISFQIQDVALFAKNPIDFYPYMKNHVQNELLDSFAQASLRDFMSTFSNIAFKSVESCNDYFSKFGIAVLDVQVLDYKCIEKRTDSLLKLDIHTNVTKQNELRARQNDILIQEQSNEVAIQRKDLEVAMALKDNEVALQKKQLSNDIRLKEMDISILEEVKKTELLSIKRGNDLLEAEFEGRSKGHEFKEFLKGVDQNFTREQKLSLWNRVQDMIQTISLYEGVKDITMYPPNSDLKLFNFGGDKTGKDVRDLQEGVMRGIGQNESQTPSRGIAFNKPVDEWIGQRT
jgi:hypothetical protein